MDEQKSRFSIWSWVFTPKDAWRAVWHVATHFTRRDYWGMIIAGLLMGGLRSWTTLSWEGVIFWLFTLIMFYWRLDSRISIGLGLVCLITIALLTSFASAKVLPIGEEWAERVAVWAYYFLVIGVAKQIVEYAQECRRPLVTGPGSRTGSHNIE